MPAWMDWKAAYVSVRTGPGFLTFPNFRVIRRYNNSASHALGVVHLAVMAAGGRK